MLSPGVLPTLATTNELVAISNGDVKFCVSWHPAKLLNHPRQVRDLNELIRRYRFQAAAVRRYIAAGMHLVHGPIDCFNFVHAEDDSSAGEFGKVHFGTTDPETAARFDAGEARIELGDGFVATYQPHKLHSISAALDALDAGITSLEEDDAAAEAEATAAAAGFSGMWELTQVEKHGRRLDSSPAALQEAGLSAGSDPWRKEWQAATAAAQQRQAAAAAQLRQVLEGCQQEMQQLLSSGLLPRERLVGSFTDELALLMDADTGSHNHQATQMLPSRPAPPVLLPEIEYSTYGLVEMAGLEGARLQFVYSMEQEALYHQVASMHELALVLSRTAEVLAEYQALGAKLIKRKGSPGSWQTVEIAFRIPALLRGCPVTEARMHVPGVGVFMYVLMRDAMEQGSEGIPAVNKVCWRSLWLEPSSEERSVLSSI